MRTEKGVMMSRKWKYLIGGILVVAIVGGAGVGLSRMRVKDAPEQETVETAKGENANPTDSTENKTTENDKDTTGTEEEKQYVESAPVIADSVIGPGENSQKLAPKPIVTPSGSSSSGSEGTKEETPGQEEQKDGDSGNVELPMIPLN